MRQPNRNTFFIFSIAVVIAVVGAVSPSLAQGPPGAAAILSQAAAVLGVGPGSLTSATVTGTITHFDPDGTRSVAFETKTTGPGRVRWDLVYPTGTMTTVVRGGGGWITNGTKTRPLSLSEVSGQTIETLPIFGLSYWLSSPNVELTYVGQVEIDGLSYHKVEIVRSHPGNPPDKYQKAFRMANRSELYIDPANLSPVRLRYYAHPGDWRREVPVDLIMGDFQPMGGVVMPAKITRYVGTRKTTEIQIQLATFNDVIDDAVFARN